jgi:type II secretory pathway component GspD/PulD (secretin)
VARATKLAWISVAMGMALAPAGAVAQAPATPGTAETAAPVDARPSKTHSALKNGIDSYRKGEHEAAAKFFEQAKAAQNDLSANERQDLETWTQLNNAALQARREGGDKVRQAEEAAKAGKTQEALDLLKTVTPSQQFLSPADKQKAQQLGEQLRPASTNAKASNATTVALARAKLQQARAMIAKGNYEAAQALATEAEQLGVTYSAGEDTPKKVLDEISKARTVVIPDNDPKGYLTAARKALDHGDLDLAEHLAKEAEKKGGTSMWSSLKVWGDSPAKVLRDVQTARARQAKARADAKGKDAGTSNPLKNVFAKNSPADDKARTVVEVKASPTTEAARQLLKDARKAQQDGDNAKAKALANQAKALQANLTWWDDSPDKVLADVAKAEGGAATKDGSVTREVVLQNVPSDPHAQLKMAREMMNAGKLDEADKLAQMANSSKSARWGLFDDSPDKVVQEVRKLRAKHDQQESGRVLAEARKVFEKANGDATMLDEAEKLAYKAERLHGEYSVLDLGDRPQKLRAEIDAARAKSRKPKLPPAPPTATVQKDPDPVKPSASTSMVAQVSAQTTEKAPSVPPVVTTSNTPTPLIPPAATPVASTPERAVVQVRSDSPKVPVLPVTSSKPQAQRLLAEARQLQKEGKLIEARQKAMEAQKLGATFEGDEDRPDMALLAISSLAEKRIETLLQQAHDAASATSGDPGRFQKAEAALNQAKQLAEAFGFDAQPVQAKMAWVKQQQDATPGAVPAAVGATPAAVSTPLAAGGSKERGETLLNQARLELRRGETGTARRLAEEAFTGNYGVRDDAEKLLRSIDTEEFNQKVLAVQRSFDAGLAAYQRKDYAQAGIILRSIDKQMLPPEKQVRLKELMAAPELQGHTVAQAAHKTESPAAPGRAQASDQAPAAPAPAEADALAQVKAMQKIKFEQLRLEGLRVQRDANARFGAGETDKALDMLREYKNSLADAPLEPNQIDQLRRPVEVTLQKLVTLKSRRDFEKLEADQQEANTLGQQRKFAAEENKKKQVAELMRQYNAYFKEGKYKEAEMYAMRAHELDPDNAIADAAVYTARVQGNLTASQKANRSRENQLVNAINDAMDAGPDVNTDHPLALDKDWAKTKGRRPSDMITIGVRSEKERQIESKMQSPISLNFSDTPLRQVIDDLRDWTGINIVPDEPALGEDGISLDRPITMKLEGVSLKSALNLILHQVHLTHVIKDDVLQITTESHARGKLQTKSYNVADLVMPIPDASPATQGLMRASLAAGQGDAQNVRLGGAAPWLGSQSLAGGANVSQMQTNPNGVPNTGPTVTKENPKGTIEDLLINLITKTIAPNTWSSMGGQATIEYYPLGMALIINQTPDIQEQIADLLGALRRLQDQEVSIEIKFITIAESFFERIGVDFNVNLKTDRYTTKYEPQIVSQQFKPFGFVNDFNPKNLIVGLTPANTFTQDLDIPIRTSSFAQAIPPFGAFPNIPGGNGGIDLGLAFLSDIQVFLFMEAAQGDQRTNVMQAPKLTLFNGQTSTITITDQQFFVTNVTVLQQGGQVVFVPANNLLPTGGISLTMNAVVTADRRFVRMSLTPTITNIASAVIPLFPITTFITPVFEGGAVGQPIPFTQFLQQPVFNTITVATTVAVPDGGTVLLGGLKRLSEGRNEFGPPILSKIPIINRLFKNVGYGREAESLLMMVTPRIIINEEEELKQTGVDRNAPPGGGPAGP